MHFEKSEQNMLLKTERSECEDDGIAQQDLSQLYDKCCNALKDYMYQCQGFVLKKNNNRFCTAWEDLKWERDTFAEEINRRDCCGEGVIDEKIARKLRRKKMLGI